jgi:transcriptional regulator with XRE-family HTH domain
LRGDRGFTQEELSAVSGISTRLISALESNARTSARLSTISKLANALDVEVGELVDRRDHLKNDRDGGSVLAVRDALLNPRLLPGIDDADDGEPTPLEQLNKQVDEAWSKYWSGRFGELLALLPGLIGEARVTHAGLGSTAVQPLALTYDLAASLMTQIGRNDLGAIAAERAITTAYGGDDQLLWAILHGRYSWVMFHQGRYMEGESLAAEMAQRIDPSFSDSDREISVWGTLLTYAIAPAAAQEHDPDEYLSLAGAGAARLRQPVQVYNSRPFSSAMVHMQATYAYSTLKKPGEALKAAKHIRPTTPNQPGDLAGISRGAHLMDVAQAHLDAGHKNAAVRKLLEAREVSEVWFRHQRVARAAVTEIRERERRLSPEVKSLARSLDL